VYLYAAQWEGEFEGTALRHHLLTMLITSNILNQQTVKRVYHECFVTVSHYIKIYRQPIKPEGEEGINAINGNHQYNPHNVFLVFRLGVVPQVLVYEDE
jgi:hypothetical protein